MMCLVLYTIYMLTDECENIIFLSSSSFGFFDFVVLLFSFSLNLSFGSLFGISTWKQWELFSGENYSINSTWCTTRANINTNIPKSHKNYLSIFVDNLSIYTLVLNLDMIFLFHHNSCNFLLSHFSFLKCPGNKYSQYSSQSFLDNAFMLVLYSAVIKKKAFGDERFMLQHCSSIRRCDIYVLMWMSLLLA